MRAPWCATYPGPAEVSLPGLAALAVQHLERALLEAARRRCCSCCALHPLLCAEQERDNCNARGLLEQERGFAYAAAERERLAARFYAAATWRGIALPFSRLRFSTPPERLS